MANESESRVAGLGRELLSFDMYKRTQGRRVRSLTIGGIGLFLAWGLISLHEQLKLVSKPIVAYGVPTMLAAGSAWLLFRIYNWPRFAEFLIATEAEMGKVSWSSKQELKRATLVVLLTLFLVAAFLFSVDLLWSTFLEKIGVLLPVRKVTEPTALLDWFKLARDHWTSLA